VKDSLAAPSRRDRGGRLVSASCSTMTRTNRRERARRWKFDESRANACHGGDPPGGCALPSADKAAQRIPGDIVGWRAIWVRCSRSARVHSIRDLDELQAQILELIFECRPRRAPEPSCSTAPTARIQLGVRSNRDSPQRQFRAREPHDCAPVLEQGLAVLGSIVPGSTGLATLRA